MEIHSLLQEAAAVSLPPLHPSAARSQAPGLADAWARGHVGANLCKMKVEFCLGRLLFLPGLSKVIRVAGLARGAASQTYAPLDAALGRVLALSL